MKTSIVITLTLLSMNLGQSQTVSYNSIKKNIINLGAVHEANEDFENFSALKPILKDVEIVMLGEQSHGEGTAYDTKIKLIKYLHQELGFDLLVFESDFYACHKAWKSIETGENVRDALGRSIFYLWSTTNDLEPLADYVKEEKDSDKPLTIAGFDSQLSGKYTQEYLLNELTDYLLDVDASILKTKEWAHFSESISLLLTYNFKELKKRNSEQDLTFLLNLIDQLSKTKSGNMSDFWMQTIKNTHACLSDICAKTDLRDKQMAENLIWIKEKYPNRKIICWGATSHFLYNSEEVRMKSPIVQIFGGNYYKKQAMMGEYIKTKYQEKVYTIGFTAYQGEFGLTNRKKIKPPKEGTLEFLLGQSEYDNFLLPLNDLNLEAYNSRPLGNYYMISPANKVMDALIFNRYMKRPKLDRNFFLKIYPENKYIKPEVIE